MSVTVPNGTEFAIAGSYAAAVPITKISNAAIAIFSAANT
ncbi:hypothetical protein S2091_2173 [Solimicrobium silvestre]|uniref:Uncharacterized protein n=1 Tax=Solimicrobium silvestre TaxID=2099400 RepID=A0A2S9GZF4_9BURK|nr:hypothetical protein S2091_2173 [Solimicrobium silvestre]